MPSNGTLPALGVRSLGAKWGELAGLLESMQNKQTDLESSIAQLTHTNEVLTASLNAVKDSVTVNSQAIEEILPRLDILES